MGRITSFLDQKLYPNHRAGWDHLLFRQAVRRALRPADVVLDFGAGRGGVSQLDFRRCASRVCGVDVDPVVLTNPLLHEARLITAGRIPYDDNTFDLVFSTCVWEHLDDPDQALAEVFRVLRPGGLYFGKTPSRFHYVCLIAAVTPHWFHELVNRRRGRNARDTFPTHYKLNSQRAIRRCAHNVGFHVREIESTEGRPEYLRFSAVTYICGWLYEQIVNSTRVLAPLRVTMTAILEKPSSATLQLPAKRAA